MQRYRRRSNCLKRKQQRMPPWCPFSWREWKTVFRRSTIWARRSTAPFASTLHLTERDHQTAEVVASSLISQQRCFVQLESMCQFLSWVVIIALMVCFSTNRFQWVEAFLFCCYNFSTHRPLLHFKYGLTSTQTEFDLSSSSNWKILCRQVHYVFPLLLQFCRSHNISQSDSHRLLSSLYW